MYYAIMVGTNNIFRITFTPVEVSGQPGQMRSLIIVFLSRASIFSGTFALPNFYNKKCTEYIMHQITAHKCNALNIIKSKFDDDSNN